MKASINPGSRVSGAASQSAPEPGSKGTGADTPVLTEALLSRFDVSGPRYTSYPTADRFTPAFGEADFREALRSRATSSAALSLYVHIPFCEIGRAHV